MPAATLTAVKTVIVADDTAFVRDRFKTALGSAGHRTITVRTGVDLVAQVRECDVNIDLVVLDLRIPQGHGIELVKTLKAIPTLTAPILVFSGTIASADEVRELSSLGVAGYVNEYTAVQNVVRCLAPFLFPDNHNRRSSPRVTLAVPISYRVGNAIASALTLNLSLGGVAVRTTSPLPPQTNVKVRFRIPEGKEIEAEARVTWIDRLTGMGLEFTKVDDADRRVIEAFVQGHFFTNRKK